MNLFGGVGKTETGSKGVPPTDETGPASGSSLEDPETGATKVYCRATGVYVTPFTLIGFIGWVQEAITTGDLALVAGHNLHSAYLYHTDDSMREFYDKADVVLCDGAPVVWDYRISGGQGENERLGSTDWLPRISELRDLNRICVIGARDVPNGEFADWLQSQLPEVKILAIPGTDWNTYRSEQAITEVLRFQPQLVIVGLGMPLQERFILQLANVMSSGVIAGVGGAIDQITGHQVNAPRWIGKYGVEWAWRLAHDPARLWKRYLIEPWKLLGVRISSLLFKGEKK